jgi:hypothetical protein
MRRLVSGVCPTSSERNPLVYGAVLVVEFAEMIGYS